MASVMSLPNELENLARIKWRGSGLTDEQAAILGLEVVPGDQAWTLAPNFKRLGGIKIPYFRPDGTKSGFFRFRYLEKPTGFAAQVDKEQRYVQPIGTLNEVYLPPLLSLKWSDILANPKIPIFITEGELKSACACSRGFPTIGLGGVDVWRSQKRGVDFLPDLAEAAWANRSVTIVFDSDSAVNPNVVRASLKLSAELTARGAIPSIASLPAGPSGEKQGLDDYLVRHSNEDFVKLVEESPGADEARALWLLSEEVVYIRDPGLIVVRDTGQKMAPNNFVHHAYSNRHYMESSVTKKGVQVQKKPLARRWLDWEQRFQLKRITYAPGQPFITDKQEWNQWRGWGCSPVPGDIGPWTRLLDYVFRDRHEERKWFEKWCAYPLQHPGTKLFTSVVIWSVHQGTGKTLLGYTLRNIYGDNATEIKDKHLHAGFNEWAENKQFIIGDEVTSRSDKRDEADHIKGLITNEEVRINAKYVPSYVVPDCINYYFTSNNPDAFFLEDTDRRFFIHEIIGRPAELGLYHEYDRWVKGNGPSHLFHYLLNLDTSDFHPRAPAPTTASKRAMIVDNKSDLGMFCHNLKENPSQALANLGSAIAAEECDLFTSEQLHLCYDPDHSTKVTINGLGRELKRAGFRKVNDDKPVRTAAGLMRLYAVRNVDKWEKADPQEIAAHWNKYFTKGGKY